MFLGDIEGTECGGFVIWAEGCQTFWVLVSVSATEPRRPCDPKSLNLSYITSLLSVYSGMKALDWA